MDDEDPNRFFHDPPLRRLTVAEEIAVLVVSEGQLRVGFVRPTFLRWRSDRRFTPLVTFRRDRLMVQNECGLSKHKSPLGHALP